MERHYGEGPGTGRRIMNPQTVVYLEEGASLNMESVQIRGVDSTKRETKVVVGPNAEAVITEKLLTHGEQTAESDMEIILDLCDPAHVFGGIQPPAFDLDVALWVAHGGGIRRFAAHHHPFQHRLAADICAFLLAFLFTHAASLSAAPPPVRRACGPKK